MSFNIGDTVIRLDDGNGHTVVDVVPTGIYIKLKDVRGWYVADDFRAADRLDALQYVIPEEGGKCPQCSGTMELPPVENCRCHINPPCSACTSLEIECDSCGWTVGDPIIIGIDPSAKRDENPDNAREFREILGGRRGRARVAGHSDRSKNYPYPPENETLARAVDITAAAEHPQAMWRVDR